MSQLASSKEARRSQELHELADELCAWLPSETSEFQELVARILASLPGGERLADPGYEPLVGWKEVELLGKLCDTLQDASDVKLIVDRLFGHSIT